MGTRGVITESQLMAAMPRNPNPYLGFRGNEDGEESGNLVDYGVYAPPLHNALLQFDYASVPMQYVTDRAIKLSINKGWPVVAWVSYGLQRSTPRLSVIKGVQFFLVPHEHAILVVGYDNRTVFANDPWTGKVVRYYWWKFNRSWGYFGNMALSIEPCPLAAAVHGLSVAPVTSAAITWTWKPATNAARYMVTVVRRGVRRRVVQSGTQTATTLSVANPVSGDQYGITVTALNGCGSPSTSAHLVVQLPAALPTPTPSVTPILEKTTVTAPTSTASPTVTPTP